MLDNHLCGFTWNAPHFISDETWVRIIEMCVLKKGHDGPHQSGSKIFAPNENDKRVSSNG